MNINNNGIISHSYFFVCFDEYKTFKNKIKYIEEVEYNIKLR